MRGQRRLGAALTACRSWFPLNCGTGTKSLAPDEHYSSNWLRLLFNETVRDFPLLSYPPDLCQ